jgi:hypothetical protein
MHPQAPNTQTFLPACLLPTACDYNGLDCFDPLAVGMAFGGSLRAVLDARQARQNEAIVAEAALYLPALRAPSLAVMAFAVPLTVILTLMMRMVTLGDTTAAEAVSAPAQSSPNNDSAKQASAVAYQKHTDGVVSSANKAVEHSSDATASAGVALKDDPRFSKCIKMLQMMHVPKGAIALKMKAEGLGPTTVLDIDPSLPTPSKDSEPKLAIKDDPRFSKFFKMLQMQVPKGAVALKMKAEGLDTSVLNMDPNLPTPSKDSEPKLAIKDDPRFSIFFKMIQMHVPKGAVALKIQADGLDPTVLDMGPNLSVPNKQKAKESSEVKDKSRRKRLHWKSIDQSLLRASGIWSNLQDGASSAVIIDDAEFEDLFVEKDQGNVTKIEVKKSKQVVTKIQIVDSTRAMNGAIAMARVRVTFNEIATALKSLRGAAFTADQLISLTEFLPTEEEAAALSNYVRGKGEVARLGETERFMVQMIGVPDSAERFRCLSTQKRFSTVRKELSAGIKIIQRACDDVKGSVRLKKLLAVVLKLGNKLNVGAKQVNAFTLDSLIKLKDSKAFDKKTSVMQFLVRLIAKQEPDTLHFCEDLANIPCASQVSTSTILTEFKQLDSDLVAAQLVTANENCGLKPFLSNLFNVGALDDAQLEHVSCPVFIRAARTQLEELRVEVLCMQRKYLAVLSYFGENPELNSEDFFRSLNEFGALFKQTTLEENEVTRLEMLKPKATAGRAASPGNLNFAR